MMKVGGIYVSPLEVEAVLLHHPSVAEVAVVARRDDAGLVKPCAFIVTADGAEADEKLGEDLKSFVKTRLAPYKYPRWIEFVTSLPKTATGKIERYRLRS